MGYTYRQATKPSEALEHADHTVEEWHAYVCDTSEAPSWATGNASGLCCHTCEVVLVEVDDRGVAIAPVEVADGPEYEFACLGTITCEPLLDRHGRECERANDEARADFYVDAYAAPFARSIL